MARFRVFKDRLYPFGWMPRIDGDVDAAGLQDGQHGRKLPRAAWHRERDASSGTQSPADPLLCQTARGHIQLCIGEVVVLSADRRLVRVENDLTPELSHYIRSGFWVLVALSGFQYLLALPLVEQGHRVDDLFGRLGHGHQDPLKVITDPLSQSLAECGFVEVEPHSERLVLEIEEVEPEGVSQVRVAFRKGAGPGGSRADVHFRRKRSERRRGRWEHIQGGVLEIVVTHAGTTVLHPLDEPLLDS